MVVIALLPSDTTVADLARVRGLSPGLLSAGISKVAAVQTYLDIGQGARVSPSLYHASLPSPYQLQAFTDNHTESVPEWRSIVDRAGGVPADVVPGLLATTLRSQGVLVRVERRVTDPALIVADAEGRVRWLPPKFIPCRRPLCVGVTLLEETLHNTRRLVGRLRGNDLLIALATPRGGSQTVPIGVAGSGFDGNLTSDSTRTDGYALSADIAPTILRRYGLDIPDEMEGEPIRAVGQVDPTAVDYLGSRMSVIPDRRAPVVILSLVGWIVVAAVVGMFAPTLRRRALAWLALAFAYMPLMLLAGAAIEPSAIVEGLLVGFGAAGLAALTVALIRGWWALAVVCAITVVAYAIDVMTGSELTKLSLLGPNPVFGVRFYGIGNELEALIAVMVPVAVGAGLTAWSSTEKPGNERWAVVAFIGVSLLAAVVFALGRFGADIGAAIVLPIGGAVAAVIAGSVEISGRYATTKRHGLVLAVVIAAPLLVVAAVALIDLVSGGDSHLSRSVLDVGGAGALADIAQRRLELSAHDFAQAAGNPLFWLVIAGICVCLARWRRIDAWLRPAPLARAGLLGACAAVAAGVLVNDSGATFLVLGSLALGATLAFAWAQAGTDP
jgi:hypothetical protein